MNIQTKFNIGDKVLVLNNFEIISSNIKQIKINITGCNIREIYILEYETFNRLYYNPEELFKTKEELVNALLKQSK